MLLLNRESALKIILEELSAFSAPPPAAAELFSKAAFCPKVIFEAVVLTAPPSPAEFKENKAFPPKLIFDPFPAVSAPPAYFARFPEKEASPENDMPHWDA